MGIEKDILNRSQLLMGDEAMERLASLRVIVFGVGGVGSWCAESLVRSGVGHITIVDSDKVCVTNVNRQAMATTKTIGQVKVEAMKERLLTINPYADIDARQQIFSEETASSFDLDNYDFIVDAIDSLKDKMLLIEMACRTKAKFFSSMGAALKMDPTKVQVAEFWKVKGCPLARALRQRFNKLKRKPARKFKCVFSEELLPNRTGESGDVNDGSMTYGKVQVNGSMMHITAIFGLTIAGLILNEEYNTQWQQLR
ncbi:MAG: ThiF family adenylyltransferase [Prevotella sp.]